MARRHVEEYFKQVCNDYRDMIEAVHDLEVAVSENAISPERFDEFKKQLEIIKANYMRWSYVMFLLDMPNKKDKAKKYEKQILSQKRNKPQIDKSELKEDKEALKQFKKEVNSLSDSVV